MENTVNTQATNNETQENNKLIAEFMGLKLKGGGRSIFDEPNLNFFRVTEYEKDGLCPYCHNGVGHGRNIACYVLDTERLHYDTDWNLLMPVVIKCYEETDEQDSYWEAIYYSVADLDKDKIYTAVIKFIKWYNANN